MSYDHSYQAVREAQARRPVTMVKGYRSVYCPNHPRSNSSGYVREHILVASCAIGKAVPLPAVIHHVNDKTDDNRPSNLVICQDDAYHKLLHYRRRIFRAGGDPDTQAICSSCQQVRYLSMFSPRKNGPRSVECRTCVAQRVQEYSARNRSAVNARQNARRRAVKESGFGV